MVRSAARTGSVHGSVLFASGPDHAAAGAYDEALAEFAQAQRRYQKEGTTAPAGMALTEQGDVLRIRGKLDEAEASYRQAAELGHEPQPGLALAWLARGRTTAAISAVRRLLAEAHDPVRRSWMLPAGVEVLVSAQLLDEARQNSDELTGIASAFGSSAIRAMATYAAASVHPGVRRDGGGAQQRARVLSPLDRSRVAVRGCAGTGRIRACIACDG